MIHFYGMLRHANIYVALVAISTLFMLTSMALGQGRADDFSNVFGDLVDKEEPKKPLAQRLLEERIEQLKADLEESERELARMLGESYTPSPKGSSEPLEEEVGALVVVRGPKASGSGFVASIRGKTFFVTNIHVLGAARDASFSTINGDKVKLSQVAFLSKNRDLAIVPVEWNLSLIHI